MKHFAVAAVVFALTACCLPLSAQELFWDEVYKPFVVRHLHVSLTAEDYRTIQEDESFDIQVPAFFRAEGEDDTYHITIRRKSATPIGEKISYRIGFESKVSDPTFRRWHDLKSLSLENGDDQDVVSQGLAWYLHRQASTPRYQPSLAAWVKLTIHVVNPVLDEDGQPIFDEDGTMLGETDVRPQGVYLNVELPEKQFLQNRGLWGNDRTWLYQQDDIGRAEIKEWPLDPQEPEDSPHYKDVLTYSPFQVHNKTVPNPPPADDILAEELNHWINMDAMLRLGAAIAFAENADSLFKHGKNFYWVDYIDVDDHRRLYLPWDLDASIRQGNGSIYASSTGGGRKGTVSQHPYEATILNHPTFRAQYNQIMAEMLDGPWAVAVLQDFLDEAEAVLTVALLDDPNNQIGNTPEAIAEHFNSLRVWVEDRHASVRAQLAANGPPAPRK